VIWNDYDFWNGYYRWSIRTPLMRSMDVMSRTLISVQLTLRDTFTPVVRKVGWAFEDFSFEMGLWEQPRWKWPLLRFRHWVGKARRYLPRLAIGE
jgi:hypothetical protein